MRVEPDHQASLPMPSSGTVLRFFVGSAAGAAEAESLEDSDDESTDESEASVESGTAGSGDADSVLGSSFEGASCADRCASGSKYKLRAADNTKRPHTRIFERIITHTYNAELRPRDIAVTA